MQTDRGSLLSGADVAGLMQCVVMVSARLGYGSRTPKGMQVLNVYMGLAYIFVLLWSGDDQQCSKEGHVRQP